MRNKETLMTEFNKDRFETNGPVIRYAGDFVARFKYGGGADFKRFLIKNFTVEEYFGRLADGELPLPILESKGFISTNMKKALKRAGYPTTAEGKKDYFASLHRYNAPPASATGMAG